MSERNVEGGNGDSLDSFFHNDHDDVSHVQDVDHVESVHHELHNDEDHEDHQNTSIDEPKKSLFKRWYFWVGSIGLFIGIVGALYVQQMMALRSTGQMDQSPIVMADPAHTPNHPVTAISQVPPVPVVEASATSIVTDHPSSLPIAVAAASIPITSAEIPSGGKTEIASTGIGKNVDNSARIDELEKQVSALSNQLKEVSNAKQVTLDKIAIANKNSQKNMTTSQTGRKHKMVAKAKKMNQSNMDESNLASNFMEYHIDAITPGQARVTHGNISEYVTIGSVINGSKVLRINPDAGEIVTSSGAIR
jgi:hypothetical protein